MTRMTMRKTAIKKTTLTLLITILASCWTADAQAHGMSLFASHDGKAITGTVEYHGGVPVVDAEVTVTAGDDSEWWKTQTNRQGKFIIDVQPHDEYKVVADAGGGHRSETVVKAMPQGSSAASDAQIVELRREIHDLKNSIQLRDILGGVGYILGLVGIAMYFKAKERRTDG